MKKSTKKQLSCLACFLFMTSSNAGLVQINDDDLSKMNGQTGVLIDANLILNRTTKTDTDGRVVADKKITCAAGGNDCEYALRFDGSDKWLVIYDMSGGIDLKNYKISATTVAEGTANERPAIALGNIDDTNSPVTATFDNFGASSWAFTGGDGVTPGYRVSVPMGANNTLDEGKPKGLWDMRIHGTLSMTGGLKIFNCAGMQNC